jgi:hypothetical protein
MASFAARRSPRAAWSVEECARFAALKEYELLRLLSTDKKALMTARRLGLTFSQSQPQPPISASAGGSDTESTARPPDAATASVTVVPNARQRRSAARSAQHHAARRAQLCNRSMLAIFFMVRLRRLVDGTLRLPESDDDGGDRRSTKRGSDDRPPSSLSSSSSRSASSTRSAGQPHECSAIGPPVQHRMGRQEKRPKAGLMAGFLLR